MSIIDILPEEQKKAILDEITTKYVTKEEFEKVKSHSEQLLDEAKKAKATKTAAEAEADRVRLEAAAKTGDIESLKQSYENKLEELNNRVNSYEVEKKNNKILGFAEQFVKDNFVSDSLIREASLKEFSSRLDVRDGEVVVLDPKGNLTANTIDDLKKEFMSSERYKQHIIGSKANGGGTTGTTGTKGITSTKKDLSSIPLSDKEGRLAIIRARLNK